MVAAQAFQKKKGKRGVRNKDVKDDQCP